MAKINVLDKYVAELIAAGEVVERPASAIKEMIENSIDAGATIITVEINNGGISYMRIQDNGCGISREDVPLAFVRHATSKIKIQDDLDAIGTLGFRGEALASICAMARVEMLTRVAEDLAGTRYVIEGGDEICCEDVGCPQGTTIIVRDLFYNTPARMKFLKKDVSEGNAISIAIDKAALSHPEISFRFIRDGKEVLRTSGDGNLKSVIVAVFGREFASGLLPVDYTFGAISVKGFVSRPSDARPKRGMQNFFINGRYIKSAIASAALEQACKGMVMTGKFASCVLHMTVPAHAVDVNVHPAKTEVRFINERPIFDAVYRAASEALSKTVSAEQIRLTAEVVKKPIEKEMPKKSYSQLHFAVAPERKPAGTAKEFVERLIRAPEVNIQPKTEVSENVICQNDDRIEDVEITVSAPTVHYEAEKEIVQPEEEKPIEIPLFEAEKKNEKQSIIENALQEEEEVAAPVIIEEEIIEEEQHSKKSEPLRLVGEAFKTYILLETDKELIYIDKHAAHERIIYEKLKRENGKRYAQQLLCPLAVTLDKEEYAVLLENAERLENVGFEISDFGAGTLIVRSIPMSFGETDVKDSLIEIASYLAEHRSDISTKHDDWLYHNIACRAAIKAGDENDSSELYALAQQLHDNPEIRYCPHGRPIYLAVAKNELEKRFGRA